MMWVGAQEFKKLFEESMQKNSKFVGASENEETAEDTQTNGTPAKETAKEDKTQDKASSDLADSIQSKVKGEDS